MSSPIWVYFYQCSRSLIPLPTSLHANSEDSGETVRIRRLAWAIAGHLCDKHHNLMSWLKYSPGIENKAERQIKIKFEFSEAWLTVWSHTGTELLMSAAQTTGSPISNLEPNIHVHWTSNYGIGIVFIRNMLSWLSFPNFVYAHISIISPNIWDFCSKSNSSVYYL